LPSQRARDCRDDTAARYPGHGDHDPFQGRDRPFLDELDGKARAAGAVTIVVNDRGRLIGFNTDPAYRANDTERAGGKETADAQLTDNRRLLAGALKPFACSRD
jgi:hypothetical protein